MQQWKFEETELKGLFIIHPFYSEDSRGSFIKDYSLPVFTKNNIAYPLFEVFYSTSNKGVVRGMHFQKIKQQPKLVRCISGKIFDAVVDLRKDSPTFLKWHAYYLDSKAKEPFELLIPKGFAHGFMALEDNSIVSYKCGEAFYPEGDSGIKFDDPDLAINWPFDQIGGKDKVTQSEKDKNLQSFHHFMDDYSNNF
jgi:dTDP-4-dehydrorhamnose 3,5-epimerase